MVRLLATGHPFRAPNGPGTADQAHSDALSEIESVGLPRVMDQTKVRNRILGGTSQTRPTKPPLRSRYSGRFR
jgi:hypothetical protein